MKHLFTLCFLLVCCTNVFAQFQTDSIEVRKGFSTTFRQDGEVLTPAQLLNITQSNPEAYKEMKIAKNKAAVSTVLGYAGGFLIGYPLGASISGGDANWSLAGIGAGLIAIGIPFSASYTKHATKAVHTYNNGSAQTSMIKKYDLKVGLAGNGLGLNLQF